jgi:alpha-mannosidase
LEATNRYNCSKKENTPSYQYKDGALSICLTRGIPLVTGKQNYQYSIYTHKENIYDGDAYTVAKSVNMPFLVYWPVNQVEKQMQSMSFITIDKQNIVLSALYCEGDMTFVRLYERSGKATDVNIDLPYLKTTEFKKIKLNGEEIQKIQNVNGKVKLDFKPWEIITLSFPGVK